MNVELKAVSLEEKETLSNLPEKYFYELSQYELFAFREDGLFGYDPLDWYWTEEGRAAYFIRAEGRLAGCVLLNKHPARRERPLDWAVAEFFIAYPYRRHGAGAAVMREIFTRYPGHWQIMYHPKNTSGAAFWRRMAESAASGPVELVEGEKPYEDGSPAQVLCFYV